MKIADVKVGETYAFTNHPVAEYGSGTPALVISVGEPLKTGSYGSRRTVKGIRVRWMQEQSYRYGKEDVIEARYLVRTWALELERIERQHQAYLAKECARLAGLDARDAASVRLQELTGETGRAPRGPFSEIQVVAMIEAALRHNGFVAG